MVALQNWINQAREHWKEFRPSVYRGLKEAGTLDVALQHAATQTDLEMSQLREAGMTEQEAWEVVRERYLFPPQEGSAPSDDTLMSSAPGTDMLHAAIRSGARTIDMSTNGVLPSEFKKVVQGK